MATRVWHVLSLGQVTAKGKRYTSLKVWNSREAFDDLNDEIDAAVNRYLTRVLEADRAGTNVVPMRRTAAR